MSPIPSSRTRALRWEQVKEKALRGACLCLSPGRALLFPTSWCCGDRSAWAPLRCLEAFTWRQGRSLLCPPSSVCFCDLDTEAGAPVLLGCSSLEG